MSLRIAVLLVLWLVVRPATAAEPTVLGIDGTRFTVSGHPTFLLGMSYYGALGAGDETWRADLDDMQQAKINWIRVWATWSAFGEDVSAVDGAGRPRDKYLARLKDLVNECDRRGMMVDVTLSRGNGVTGPSRLQSREDHQRAVETLVTALKDHRNWYLDLANERNIRDPRHVSDEELAELRATVRKLDPDLLVTASHGGDIDANDVRDYVTQVQVDFLTPHRPRDADSPAQTEGRTREYLAEVKKVGRPVPIHYQEPFRRGYSHEPTAEDFLGDLRGAIAGGAAGWCFHNGSDRDAEDGRPRRSFDLREQRLFEQLDEVEREAIGKLSRELK